MSIEQTIELAKSGVVVGVKEYIFGPSNNKTYLALQGCSRTPKCPGCASSHTWDAGKGQIFSITQLMSIITSQPEPPNSLVVSGGEVLDQALAVIDLVQRFKDTYPLAEVVLYTSHELSEVRELASPLLILCDVIVTGVYERKLEATAMAGSSNQIVHLLNDRAKVAYRNMSEWPKHKLQIFSAEEDGVLLLGIPDTKRINVINKRLTRGV